MRIRQVFEQRDQEETALFVSQFQREFQHRSADVAAAVDRIAAQERVRNMAFELVQSGDAAPFLNEAQTLAQDARLDFLEIVGPDGNIVSSAQWPARFGYPEPIAKESDADCVSEARGIAGWKHRAGTVCGARHSGRRTGGEARGWQAHGPELSRRSAGCAGMQVGLVQRDRCGRKRRYGRGRI